MAKYVCPDCGGSLSMTRTLDYSVDGETGLLECPIIDNFVHCDDDCGWDSQDGNHDTEEVGLIIDTNVKADII